MDFSPYNKLRNNSVIGGDFSVWGPEIKDFYQDIDLTNKEVVSRSITLWSRIIENLIV